MHIIHELIWVPKISQKDLDTNVSSFEVSPLPRGYGVTLWNSLRRVLLSTIPGTKVTWIKVKWVSHEYSSLPGVKDSVLDIMLNLKDLIIDKKDIWIEWLKLEKNKAGVVTAWDIKTPAGVEILNKDLYITEIDKDWLELDIEIRVEKNVWYKSIEDLKQVEEDVNVLLVDANFSPVLNVKYEIEKVRSWDISNLEKLKMEVLTSWVIRPVDALKFSADILTSYFGLFNEEGLQVEWQFISDVKELLEKEKEEIKEELEKETYTPIEIMWLSPRTLNALINWNILSVEQLTKCTETKLGLIKWFGKKAMTEIREALAERWLKLLWDD
jgi:DNA-directed RNA polymerase subunit alpha